MKNEGRIEIPQIDIPDEITHTNHPEVEITTPHPVVPQPDLQQQEGATEATRHIGFR
jgi:hypothetical protein